MPSNFIQFDLPGMNGQSTERQIREIKNYIQQLTEELRYQFRNLKATEVEAGGITKLDGLDAASWLTALGAQAKLTQDGNTLRIPVNGKAKLVFSWGRVNLLSGTTIQYGVTYDSTPTVICNIQGPSENVWGCRPNAAPGTEEWTPIITRIVNGAGAEDTTNRHIVHWLAIGTVTEEEDS